MKTYKFLLLVMLSQLIGVSCSQQKNELKLDDVTTFKPDSTHFDNQKKLEHKEVIIKNHINFNSWYRDANHGIVYFEPLNKWLIKDFKFRNSNRDLESNQVIVNYLNSGLVDSLQKSNYFTADLKEKIIQQTKSIEKPTNLASLIKNDSLSGFYTGDYDMIASKGHLIDIKQVGVKIDEDFLADSRNNNIKVKYANEYSWDEYYSLFNYQNKFYDYYLTYNKLDLKGKGIEKYLNDGTSYTKYPNKKLINEDSITNVHRELISFIDDNNAILSIPSHFIDPYEKHMIHFLYHKENDNWVIDDMAFVEEEYIY
ncbi:hypothetical protein MY04_4140 [Flammeovirga sp. MY04]|uniref:hypothetical protein n=1 Tax=Flammeovirga sp. MY04 TaxID=1191459 RepID=UPI0008062266|nr:hypothetical protein [Flammeovirga sp. MY04]ANQ51484.1 hypothetical protein MY04_4140 [Flammeovirga sp. MY04]